jgi:hypothetical protein
MGDPVTASAMSSYLVGLVAALAAIAVMPRKDRRWQAACLLLIVGLALAFLLLLPVSPLRRLWLGIGAALAIIAVLAARLLWDRIQNRPPNGIVDFRVDAPLPGTVVSPFSVSQTPVVAKGKYYGEALAIRPVLIDADGRYYLQHPEVELHDDTSWESPNLRPENGIDTIAFIAVGRRGKACFDQMVAEGKWNAFSKLPPNSRLLESTHIIVS